MAWVLSKGLAKEPPRDKESHGGRAQEGAFRVLVKEHWPPANGSLVGAPRGIRKRENVAGTNPCHSGSRSPLGKDAA